VWTYVFFSSLFFLGLEDFSKSVVTVFELCLIPTQQLGGREKSRVTNYGWWFLMKVRDGWWSDCYVKSFLCVFPQR
jgi:hypothetical protein